MVNKMGYIDMHCDTLLHAIAGEKKMCSIWKLVQ